MATVTDATVRVALWENIYDALAGLTYSSSTEPGVYRNNSDIDGNDTFPRIIVNPIMVETEKDGFGRNYYSRNIKLIIDVYALKNKDIDIITDKIQNDFETRNYVGVHFIGSDNALTINTDVNQKIHMETITVTFKRG